MSEAVGIHDHPDFKTGLKPTDPEKPILELDRILSGIPVPASADHFTGATFGLYGNDQYGDCGPVSVANLVRLVSKGLTGTQFTPTQEDVFDLYKRSGNPNFPEEDNGVEMGEMLDALLKGGIGSVKPVAFARTKDTSDASIERVTAIFGGGLFAVNLLEAQQEQTEDEPPRWDYRKSPEWGGHAIVTGKYEPEPGVDAEVISWELDVQTTPKFREHQLEELWVVIFPWHLEHPAFLAGVNVTALAEAFKELTGKALPVVPPPPAPEPVPVPPPTDGGVDEKLWDAIEHWAVDEKHHGDNKRAAFAAREWAISKGFIE